MPRVQLTMMNESKVGKLSKVSIDKFILPTKLSSPSEELGDYTIVIFGEGKIGKTTLIQHFPEPYYFMCEPGGKALRLLQSRVHSWKDIQKVINALNNNRKYCRTVILDTGSRAYEMCYNYMLGEFGVTNFKDAPFGFWKEVDNEFQSIHDKIIEMGFGLVITAHCDEEEITKHGMTRHKTTLQLGKQATRFYKASMDIIAYYHYTEEEGDRVLTIRGDEFTLAGTRTDGKFLYTDGSAIKDIPMGNSSSEGYKNLIDGFNCKLINPSRKGGLKGRGLNLRIGKK